MRQLLLTDRWAPAESLLAEKGRSLADICHRAATRQQARSDACGQVITLSLAALDPGRRIAPRYRTGLVFIRAKPGEETHFH